MNCRLLVCASSLEITECTICHEKLQKSSLKRHHAVKHAGLKPVCEPGGNFPQGQGHGPFGPPPPFGQGFRPQGLFPGSPPQANVTPPPYGHPPLDQGPGFQHQGYPQQGYPPQGYPAQGYPPQGYPPQGYPPQAYPPQGYPPQGYPERTYPGQAAQPGIGQAACCGSCVACLTCLLCSCCNALMGSGIHDEDAPPTDGGGAPGAPGATTPVAPPSATADDDD